MSRIGKIARLEKCVRDELGEWIEDGVPGGEIVAWLNAQPEVREVLAEYFERQAITEQNLSDWRQGGHQEWLQYRTASTAVLEFMDNTEELIEYVSTRDLVERLSSMFAAELVQTSMVLLAGETDPEKKWKRLCEVHVQLSRLRRDEHRERPARLEEAAQERERALQATMKEGAREGCHRDTESTEGGKVAHPACADKPVKGRRKGRKSKRIVANRVKKGEGCHRGTESTEGGKVAHPACANKPVKGRRKGRKSKRIVANRVKKEGANGTGGTDGEKGGSGRGAQLKAGHTGEASVATIDTTGEKGRENRHKSGLIVANPVKKAAWGWEEIKPDEVLGESGT